MCNNFYLGPMYVIIKHWTDLFLKKLDDKTIRIITRVCPAVTKLPNWRYTTNWLRRGDQIPLIETIDARPLSPASRGTEVEKRIWLPTSPDERLCFVTYYYTECPFGKFPVTCEVDLCENRLCPGYPEAVCRVNRCGSCSYEWYSGLTGGTVECRGCIDSNGVERGEGTSWQRSECESCTCQEGVVTCSEEECPVLGCQYPVKLRGQCCQTCDAGCQYEGTIHAPKAVFSPPSLPCSDCTCNHGNVYCLDKVCINLESCQSSITLEGECCPTCLDCGRHANATQWKESPCQMCNCINAEVQCEKIHCPPLDCIHPDHPNGECCPVCVGCFYQGRIYQDGESFMPDDCTSCVCRRGSVECRDTDCPVVTCASPIHPPDSCCPVCDSGCEYYSRFYEHNSLFNPAFDPCMNCSCMNSIVRCIPVHCQAVTGLPCRRPVPVHGECCPSQCPTCEDNGIEYNHGDTWVSDSETCKVCECVEGYVNCRRRDTCALECTHGVVPRNTCCSPCTDCLYDGRLIRDGQMFIRPGDQCQQCTCTRGNIECDLVGLCPPLNCQLTEKPQGTCCPRCKGCESRGQSFQHGEVVSSDSCSRCLCEEGQVVCDRRKCPTPSCRNPEKVEGQCCPVCRDCLYGEIEHKNGERFTPDHQPCLSCLCQNGEAICDNIERECPAPTCSHPEKIPGKCCYQCEGCFFLRRRFRSGQKFVPPGGDACRVCVCRDGSIHCNHMTCPDVNCATPITLPGHCCPVCPMACTVMGKEYREGQTFTSPMDRCSVCSCNMGEITCRSMGCDPVPCSHPAVRAGECCPTCFMCSYQNRTLHNLQVFAHPTDPCQECSCREGSVSCSHVTCPAVTCANPQLGHDRCCETCPTLECEHEGVIYREGQNFPRPGDPCQDCICTNGRVSCQQRRCPAVNCPNPTKGQCCPVCQGCEYQGQIYRDNERFTSPLTKCEECRCLQGSVSCQRQSCPDLSCSHPVYLPGQCCPQCTDFLARRRRGRWDRIRHRGKRRN